LSLDEFNLKNRSQDFNKIFFEAGMINVYSSKNFYSQTKIKFFLFKLSMYSSVDIDNIENFKFVKILFKSQNI